MANSNVSLSLFLFIKNKYKIKEIVLNIVWACKKTYRNSNS